ncbi:MAG TPA: RNA polymerase sigma factor [Acidimicrobiia bacterium]|nr:RNA polymerase sigma factor [Acidimicrobiia bacterium]
MGGSPTIEEFYREHARAVYAFLVSMCRDPYWAEDLMQDTFAKATRSLGGYRGGNPRSWLFSIARSVFIDEVRKRKPEPTDEIVETPVSDPDVTETDTILRVLATLPERQRVALLLSDHAGLTNVEIAEALDASTGAAKVLIHRARLNFRKLYGEEVSRDS